MNSHQKQFVIHEHKTTDGIHWDLMLEAGNHLETYRLEKPPHESKIKSINAERIFDHPVKFLTYEGPVQNGKGTVKIVDKGVFFITDTKKDNMKLSFEGQILHGQFDLTLTKEPVWRLTISKK